MEANKVKEYIIGKDCDKDPLDGSCLQFYDKDYSSLYSLFENTDFNIYPSFTSKNYEYGKALIFDDANQEIIARYTSNGNLIIFDCEKFEKAVTINRFDYNEFQNLVIYLLDFFKSINVLTSFDRGFINNLSCDFSSPLVSNSTFRVSRNKTFFMDDMIGNTSCSKIVNINKTIKIYENVITECVSFNFFHSFNVIVYPVNNNIRIDFELKCFKSYCLINNANYDKIVVLFKKMVKKYLSTRKSIEFELDYIFTKEFFDEYAILNEMIAY